MRHHLPAFAVLLPFVLLVYIPMYPPNRLHNSVHGGDGFQALYYTNWGQHLFPFGLDLYHDLPLFHPIDGMGAISEYNLLLSMLTAPLRLLGNPVLGYNLAVLFGLLILATCSYAFCWAFAGGARRAALVGAIVYTCNSCIVWHSWGHPNIMMPAFMPLSWLMMMKFQHSGRAGWLAGAWLSALLQSLCTLYLGVATLIGLGILWVLAWGRGWRIVLAPAVSLLPLMAILFWFAHPYRELQERLGATRGLHEASLYATDALGWLLPSRFEPGPRTLLGAWLTSRIPYPQRLDNVAFFGFMGFGLAGFGAMVALRNRGDSAKMETRRMLCLLSAPAFVGAILSMGPFLWAGREMSGFRLPFHFVYEYLPPLRFMRATGRLALMASPFVAAAVAVGVSRLPAMRHAAWLGGLLLVLWVEYAPLHPPVRTLVQAHGGEAIARLDDDPVVAPIPWTEPRFLADAAATFVKSPAAHDGGSYSYRRHWIEEKMRTFPSAGSVALLAAMEVDAVVLYGRDLVTVAPAIAFLSEIETWGEGGVYAIDRGAIHMVAEMQAELEAVGERPPLPKGADFPSHLSEETRWNPGEWFTMAGEGPGWQPMEWEQMKEAPYRFSALKERFYAGFSARPLREVEHVAIRMALYEPGVDYAHARVYWLTEGMSGWRPECSVQVAVRTDGHQQVALFELANGEGWTPDATATALMFEFTTTPYPGLEVKVDEIRFGAAPER